VSVVANVAVNLDATGVVQRLKQIQTSAAGAGDAFKKLSGDARAVKAAVEASQGGFAKASTVQGVFSAKVKNTENAIRAQIAALRQVQQSVQLGGALYQKAAGQIRQYQAALDAVDGPGEKVKGLLGRLKDGFGGLVGGLTAAIGSTVLLQKAFDTLARQSKAEAALKTLGVDADQATSRFKLLSNELKGQASVVELTAAAYDVASAGFTNTADQAKILEAATKGAVGGMSDINTVGNAVTSVLNAYGLAASEAANLVDGFIQTQNDGKIVLAEYANLIGRLAPTAAAAGVGIKELNAAVATITAQGVAPETAITGLNQAIVSILKPTSEATKLAQKLGIDFTESGLRAKGLSGFLREVATATGGSTSKLTTLFGSVDALKSILPLLSGDMKKFVENLEKQDKAAGVAQKAFEDMSNTIQGAFKELLTSFENLVVAAKPLIPAIIAPIKVLAGTINLVSSNLKGILQLATFMSTFVGIMKGAAIATKAWAIATAALAAAKRAAGVAAAFLQGVINPASIGQTAIALGVAAGAAYTLGKAMDGAGGAAEETLGTESEITKETKRLTGEIDQAIGATDDVKDAADGVGDSLKEAADQAKQLAVEMQIKVVAAAKAASKAIEEQISRKAAIGSIVGAQIDGEMKLNDLYKIGLERQYKMAKTAEERKGIAIKIANNEIRNAQLVLQQTKASLQIENEKLKLQQQAAVTKGYEILAEGKLQILKAKTPEEAAQKTQQLNEALTAQNQVIKATAAEVAAQQILNGYIAKTAETQYAMSAATTTAALEQKLLGDDINMSANAAANLANKMLNGATNTNKMNELSAELSTRMDAAGKALDAGTQAAVNNAVQFNSIATNGIESQDEWRERVLAGVGAQQQVAAAAEQTTQQVVAANNIRAKSATQANKEIEDSAGFSAKRVTETWARETRIWDAAVFGPLKQAWANLVNFFPQLLKNALALVQSVFQGLVNNTKSIIRGLLQSIANAINSVGAAVNRLIGAFNRLPNVPDIPFVPTISVPAFADGGIVTKPTLAMVGEGGEPEYIIPASKMAEASANYLSGSRGNDVVPAQVGGNAQINVTTGPVLQQGGQQYVTMADLEKAMRKTADGVYASLRTPSGRYAVGVR